MYFPKFPNKKFISPPIKNDATPSLFAEYTLFSSFSPHVNCKQEYCGDNVPYMCTSRCKEVKNLPDFNIIVVVYPR